MRRLLHEEIITDYSTSFRDKWSAYVPLRVTFSLLKDEGGDISGTMCFCQDIRMEEALKKEVADKNQYLLSILQASTDGLVTLDRENRIASWNRGASALFGVEAAFALGKAIEEFLPSDAMRPAPAPANLPPETAHFEARLPRGCDTHADLLITRTAIHNASGHHAGASLVLKDITELKRLQKDLAEAEHLAELGRLAASVAHEIKNPIAGLRGAMEVMADTHELDNPRFTIFHEGLRQIRRLDSLVKDLLSFARPLALALEPVPLHMLAEASLAMVRVSAEEAGVSLKTAIPEDLPPAVADPQRLQQVIVNLVQNAVQATPAGGTVTVDAYPCNEEMALEVKDTGAGISPENMKNIFKPFFTTKHIGTGLGLSIVQRIVNAHGGRIEVGASAPQGTTFTVYLPRHSGSL